MISIAEPSVEYRFGATIQLRCSVDAPDVSEFGWMITESKTARKDQGDSVDDFDEISGQSPFNKINNQSPFNEISYRAQINENNDQSPFNKVDDQSLMISQSTGDEEAILKNYGFIGDALNLTVYFKTSRNVMCYAQLPDGLRKSYPHQIIVAKPRIELIMNRVFSDTTTYNYAFEGDLVTMVCMYQVERGEDVRYLWFRRNDSSFGDGGDLIAEGKELSLIARKSHHQVMHSCSIFFYRQQITIQSEWEHRWEVVYAEVVSNSPYDNTANPAVAKFRNPDGLTIYCIDTYPIQDWFRYRWLKNGELFLKGHQWFDITPEKYNLGAYQCQVRTDKQVITTKPIYVQFAEPCEDSNDCRWKFSPEQ